jgi:ribonuclease HI
MLGEFRKKANFDYWTRLVKASQKHQVTWTWTRGHAGHEWQERCDRAAKAIASTGLVNQSELDRILTEK